MNTPETAKLHSNAFLNHEELCDLTGFRHAKKQCEQLRKQGVAFIVNARGYPRVSRAVLDNLGVHTKPKSQSKTVKWQPSVVQAA